MTDRQIAAGNKRFDEARERRHAEQKNKPKPPLNLPKRPCSRCKGTLYRAEHFHEGRSGGTWKGVPYRLPFSGWVTGVNFWCVTCSGPGHQFGFTLEHKREEDGFGTLGLLQEPGLPGILDS